VSVRKRRPYFYNILHLPFTDPRYIDAVHTQPELEDQVGSVEKTIGDAIEESPYSGTSDRHLYADINEQDMVPDSEIAGGSFDYMWV
jgi:hypothetical protein